MEKKERETEIIDKKDRKKQIGKIRTIKRKKDLMRKKNGNNLKKVRILNGWRDEKAKIQD